MARWGLGRSALVLNGFYAVPVSAQLREIARHPKVTGSGAEALIGLFFNPKRTSRRRLVPPYHVNPISIRQLEQAHPDRWIAKAIPVDPGLL